MNRRASVVAALLALAACSSENDGPAGPLTPAKTFPIAYNLLAVAGHGDVVAALDYNGASQLPGHDVFEGILYLGRREPATPMELVDLGAVPLGATVQPFEHISVTADWVTVVLGGSLCVVSLTPPAPELRATFLTGQGVRAIASGRWLLYASGTSLFVRDLENPGSGFPQVGDVLAAGGNVTGLAEVSGGFLVFTTGGYGHVNMAGDVPAYAFTASADLRLFEKAYGSGSELFAGGPSPFLGKARVARIDATTPAAPVLAAYADVEGAYEDFAYDGAGTYVAMLQGRDWGSHGVAVLRASGNAIAYGATHDLTRVLRTEGSFAHARAGMLYTPYMPDRYITTSGAIALFLLP